MCVCVCVCLAGSPNKDYQDARLQISGRDLRSLVRETTGNTGRDFAKSHENVDSEVMN